MDGPGEVTRAGIGLVPSHPALPSCSCRPKSAGTGPDLPLHPPPPRLRALSPAWGHGGGSVSCQCHLLPAPSPAPRAPRQSPGHPWGHQRSGLCRCPCRGTGRGDSATSPALCPLRQGAPRAGGGGTVPSARQVAPVPHQWPPSLPSAGQSWARGGVLPAPGGALMAALSPLSPGCQVPPAVLPRGVPVLWGSHCQGDTGGQGPRAGGRRCSCSGSTQRWHPALGTPRGGTRPWGHLTGFKGQSPEPEAPWGVGDTSPGSGSCH